LASANHRSDAQPPAAPATAARTFTPQEQQARQAVLDGDRWQSARKQFEGWLADSSLYSDAQRAAMKQELATRIADMDAAQLRDFLAQMEARLAVLTSPEAAAARQWADAFYTPHGKQQLAEKFGVSDPVALSAAQLKIALDAFAVERQQGAAGQSAFQQAQAAQVAAAESLRKAQQAAPAQMRPATFGTPYAPPRVERPQRYVAPYDPPHYSIGPWGGVWVGF
jgi:hypothetical protein